MVSWDGVYSGFYPYFFRIFRITHNHRIFDLFCPEKSKKERRLKHTPYTRGE